MQQYLVTVAVLLVLLICAAAAILLYEVDRFGRTQSEQQLLATTRALSLVVDGELKRYEATLQALSGSEELAREDWPAFDRKARALLSGQDAWIIVGDRAGRQLVNTRLAPGAPLPSGTPPPHMFAELDSGKSRICNLSRGYLAPNILCVDLPVMRGGRAALHVSVVMLPSRIGSAMVRQRMQKGAFTTVIDRRGIVVWRNVGAERFVGKPATADIRKALARSSEGVRESHSLEGIPTVASYSRSSLSGWTFLVALPRSEMRAGTYRALAAAAGGAAILLVLGAVIGLLTARRVTRAVKGLSATAARIEQGEAPDYQPAGITEIDAVGKALEASLLAMRESEERYRRFFEQTSDLILTADLGQVITDCNPSAAAAVGLTRDEAIGRRISDFVSPDDFGRTTEMLRQKLTTGGTTRYDVRVRSSTGEWLSWEIVSGLTHDREGRPVGLHVVGRDITERKRAEEHQRLLINEL
ncbi:MAG TPA: PAS domain S-box protein, partial [Allosphingosinicella sp.]